MARYIDADRFKDTLEGASEKMHLICGVKGVDIGAVIKAVDMFPTADVVEVRHGEWRIVDSDIGYVELECSLCRNKLLFNTDDGFTYCPNCGAKMDVERREQNEG